MADTPGFDGELLGSRYKIHRELSTTSTGATWLATDVRHGRAVCVQVFAASGADPALRSAIARFVSLQHPHILPVLDSGESNGLPYIVMPYLGAESLQHYLRRSARVPLDDALWLTIEIAEALEHAHTRGVFHGDLRTETILLHDGHAHLTGFSIAPAGTEAQRGDVLSLARVLQEMLTGRSPADASLSPAIPKPIATILRRALAENPAERYPSASRFAAALARAGRENPRVPWRFTIPAPVAATVIVAVVSIIGFVLLRDRAVTSPKAPPGPRSWVLVAELESTPDDPALAKAIRQLLSIAVDQSGVAVTMPQNEIAQGLRLAGKPPGTRLDATLARELAFRGSLRTVLEGSVSRLGGGYAVALRMWDVDSSRVRLALSGVARKPNDLIPLVQKMAKRVRLSLGENPAAVLATRPLMKVATPSFEAYQHLINGMTRYQRGDVDGSRSEMRMALALDPEFAVARIHLGFAFHDLWAETGNVAYRDSAQKSFREALTITGRLTDHERLFVQACTTYDSREKAEAFKRLIPYDAINGWGNYAVVLGDFGQNEEAYVAFKKGIDNSPFGPTPVQAYNFFVAALVVGRLADADSMLPEVKGKDHEASRLMLLASRARWRQLDSLGAALAADVSADSWLRSYATVWVGVAKCAQGDLGAAGQVLADAQRLAFERAEASAAVNPSHLSMLLSQAAGTPVTQLPEGLERDTTLQVQLLRLHRECLVGDVSKASALVASLRSRYAGPRQSTGDWLPLFDAMLLARVHRFADAIAVLQPSAWRGYEYGRLLVDGVGPWFVSWTLAEDFEKANKPDSAAFYYERAAKLSGGDPQVQLQTAVLLWPFAQMKLTRLYAAMGQEVEARNHWAALRRTCTCPDARMQTRLEATRRAVTRKTEPAT